MFGESMFQDDQSRADGQFPSVSVSSDCEGESCQDENPSSLKKSRASKTGGADTPLMKQYYEIKQQHPDAVLLFRVGDFYETFGEDAVFASKVLNIVLTRKASGSHSYTELAGFPHHALETYLYKLVKAGGKVAICEQLEDPKLTKKLVKRGVTELITPGIALNDRLLENAKNNFLCGLFPAQDPDKRRRRLSQGGYFGLAFLDVSTGEFYVSEAYEDHIRQLLDNFQPSEIVVPRYYREQFFSNFGNHYYLTVFDDWVFKPDFSYELLTKHFKTNSLKGFGIEDMQAGQIAAASCLHYLFESKHENSAHVSGIQKIVEDKYVWLDAFTIRNLELLQPSCPTADTSDEAHNSLFAVLNQTLTPMGARHLRRIVSLPLKDIGEINSRLDFVETFLSQPDHAAYIASCFSEIGDMERLLSKVASLKVQPRELLQLAASLRRLAELQQWAAGTLADGGTSVLDSGFGWKNVFDYVHDLDSASELSDQIGKYINPEAPALFSKGNVIASGVDQELDEYRKIAFSGKEYLAALLQHETEASGIPNLKLGFNNVFGYYLEVTRSYKDKVPEEWVRKQTLTNAERYITSDLKAYEEKVLQAQEKISQLESVLYQRLLEYCQTFIKRIQGSVHKIAFLDVMLSFARVSSKYGYVRPRLHDGYDLDIVNGRHPVIEQHMSPGERYIPNSLKFTYDQCRIMMITGPNMSGKSAVLRQTALIVLMAQMGCFVPAEAANIGIVDKVFTRVGATDNISSGESTFMVEMNETANILNNMTSRSLVLLDEIGRGTSTYDGISIAWSIAEYIHQTQGKSAKVLFATHYHELNRMAQSFPYIKNYHVKVKEIDDRIIFLRTLAEGGSEHSFGIHVAEMAGMPIGVVSRAKEILSSLEQSRNGEWNSSFPGEPDSMQASLTSSESVLPTGDTSSGILSDSQEVKKAVKGLSSSTKKSDNKKDNSYQLSFIQLDDPLLEKIREEILGLDINSLTPLQAMNKLDEIKRLLKGK